MRWARPRRQWILGAVSLLVVTAVAVVVAVTQGSGQPTATETSPGDATPSTTSPPTTRTAPTTSLVPPPVSTTTTRASPPSSPRAATVVYAGDPSRRTVALTFDAGSDAGHATEILDTLAANGITGTFGITGRFAEMFPQVVARVAADGHQIVNHSYDHPSFTGASTSSAALPADERSAQLQRAEAAIGDAAGVGSDGWFRPPYGDIDDSVTRDVAAAGWPTILMWTVDSLGWQGTGADAVVARCLERAQPGAIYLFHVGQDADDAAALQRIIDGLRSQQYGFETVADMIG